MLLFVQGYSLFGVVDVVPGWFHVATPFHHACLIPLVPSPSVIVVAEEGSALEGSYKGVPIGYDGRSIRLAILEGLATLPAVGGGVVGIVATILQRGPGLVTVVGLGLFLLGLAGLLLLRRIPRLATFERAMELATYLKMAEEHRVQLELAFGRIDEPEARSRIAAILAEREAQQASRKVAREAKQEAKLEAKAQARGESVEALKERNAALRAKAPKRAPKPRG